MALVSLEGVDLYYERLGSGERVVFTHGAWTDGTSWTAVAERLRDRFELVLWDRRGHSRSRGGTVVGSYRDDARDLAGLIEHLGGGPLHLVGNSSEGGVVLGVVAARPELVAGAAVHEPRGAGVWPGNSEDERLAQLARDEERHLARVVEHINNGENWEAARYFIEEVAVGPGGWDALPEEARQVLTLNAPTFLEQSSDTTMVDVDALTSSGVPLMISVGTESPETELLAAKELARVLPEAQLITIDGAGHVPHRTHPDVYADLIGWYVESTSQARKRSGR